MLVNTDTLPELVTVPTLNAIVMDPLKAVISTPLIATASPAVAPALKARLKLLPSLLDGDRKNIEAPPPVFDPEELVAMTLNAPPLPSPEHTEIAILPPDPEEDEQLPRFTAPLVPTLAVPVLKDKPPDTPKLPALLVDIDTLPELVAAPTPNAIVMDPS